MYNKGMTGKKFGRLLVLDRAIAPQHNVARYLFWNCKCECGNIIVVRGHHLRCGQTKSCGCLLKERIDKVLTKHGMDRRSGPTAEYRMWIGAKLRAKKKQLPFGIKLSDITIPEYCPVLGIKLERHKGTGPQAQSPSLDRIRPDLGYVPDNILVISHRANMIKQNATKEELEKVLNYVRSASK